MLLGGWPSAGSDDTWALTSRGDELWFGTYDAGVHRMQADGRITRWAARDGLPSDIPEMVKRIWGGKKEL